MLNLMLVHNFTVGEIFWLLIIVGICTGFASVVFLSILFSLSIKETADHALKLFIFAVITAASVFTVGNLVLKSGSVSHATQSAQISNWSLNKDPDGRTHVQFQTSTPAYAYLEYTQGNGEVIPIFSPKSSEKVLNHDFFTRISLEDGGQISIIIDGKRFSVTQ